jgi:hypothetical protein
MMREGEGGRGRRRSRVGGLIILLLRPEGPSFRRLLFTVGVWVKWAIKWVNGGKSNYRNWTRLSDIGCNV